jgi:hypothetical protein
MAFTDGDGHHVAEVAYSEYGLTFQKKVLAAVGNKGNYNLAQTSHGEYGPVVQLNLSPSFRAVSNDMLGALARVVVPTMAPYVLHGRVVDVDTGSDLIWIEDPSGEPAWRV